MLEDDVARTRMAAENSFMIRTFMLFMSGYTKWYVVETQVGSRDDDVNLLIQ